MRTICFIFLAFSIINSSVCQELNCEYEDTSDFGDEKTKTYTCRLRINNPNGFDDFEQIPGKHDSEVNAIEKSVGVTSIIPSILCKQFENLAILSLAEKEIEIISKTAMASCKHLGAVYLSRNKIREIHRDAFESLRELRYLDLEENKIEELPENVFRSLSNLEWLAISNNPLYDLKPEIFKSLTSLQYLYLSGCGLVHVLPHWFASSPKLIYLELSNNNIDELPSAVFVPLTELRHFVMGNNKLTVLDSDAFEISSLKKLKSLTFNGNSLEAIDPKIFDAAESLKTARFYKNVCIDEALQVEATNQGKVVKHHENFWKFDDCFLNFKMIDKKKSRRDEL